MYRLPFFTQFERLGEIITRDDVAQSLIDEIKYIIKQEAAPNSMSKYDLFNWEHKCAQAIEQTDTRLKQVKFELCQISPNSIKVKVEGILSFDNQPIVLNIYY